MRITKFQIGNYKSYRDSGTISLGRGMNVIVGENNVGKTALLEGLGLRFFSKPHRSLRVLPRSTTPINTHSVVRVSIEINKSELADILLAAQNIDVPVRSGFDVHKAEEVERIKKLMLDREAAIFGGAFASASTAGEASPVPGERPADSCFEFSDAGSNSNFLRFTINQSRTDFVGKTFHSANKSSDFGLYVLNALKQRIYSFKAERMNLGECGHGVSDILRPDATNLAEVINHLQSNNPERFNRFNSLVHSIFPTIYRVAARPHRDKPNTLELVVWTEEPATEREDLTVPLSDSGTGVGQVLAILYVVINSRFPRTVLIDEPNSFLHPGAARKLIEIIKQLNSNDDFQFIVATHSPEIIRVADPATLMIVEWVKRESTIKPLNPNELDDMRSALTAVGARLSDVFGADSVLWVEGQTEEECYRLIAERILPGNTISIVAVRSTGDFDSKRPSVKLIWEIYTRLTKGTALIPPAIAFIFDRDGRTESEIADLEKRSGGKVEFLSRRMYENYLLDVDALTAVLNKQPTFVEKPVVIEAVKEWLRKHGSERDYGNFRSSDERMIDSKQWLKAVDGARVIAGLFQSMSEGKEEYRKTTHAVQLTEWLLDNRPEALAELKDRIKKKSP